MLMTANELAEFTRMNVQTIYRKVGSGELPCYRVGRAIRFKWEEVEEVIKCQKRKSEEP